MLCSIVRIGDKPHASAKTCNVFCHLQTLFERTSLGCKQHRLKARGNHFHWSVPELAAQDARCGNVSGLFKHQGALAGGGERRATGDDLQRGEVAKEVESLVQPLVVACQHVFELGL